MRAVVVIAVIVLVLILVGWLKFSTPDGDPTLQVDVDEIKRDTGQMVERGEKVVNGLRGEIEEGMKQDSAPSPPSPSPPSPTPSTPVPSSPTADELTPQEPAVN